jgi:hypothetical protein
MQRIRNAVLNPAWICFLWVGISAGITMIETPLRFSTPSVTREIALDIGRLLFATLNKVELLLLVVLLIIVRASGGAAKRWMICSVLALIVVAQSIWLTPELAARAQTIIAGGQPPASFAHAIYSSLEILKIGLLLYLGFSALGRSESGVGARPG